MRQVVKVLVVDDDPVSVKVIESILNREGYSVFSATNGKKGRALALETEPDLILLDVNMPEESGIETCRKLKGCSMTSDIPVMFLSAENDPDIKVESFKAGGVDYITKPYNFYETMARVKTHLRLHRANKALVEYQAAQLQTLSSAQLSLLAKPEQMPDGRFSVYYKPLHRAGGDFYEVLRSGECVFDYFLADVCGHSTGSALVTSGLKVLLHQNCTFLYSQTESLFSLNKLIRPLLTEESYVTMVWLRLNRVAEKATLVHAGHPSALFLPKGGKPHFVESEGEMLGIFKRVQLKEHEMKISCGDRFVLFSDGVLSGKGGSDIKEQKKCLLRAASENMDLSGSGFIEKVIVSMESGNSPDDDRTVLLIEV
ncbi:response regulatory protein [Chitinispirillum alkaliphilum]|nr:response regulatory protein [Chitinispirillum alkaliphilum]